MRITALFIATLIAAVTSHANFLEKAVDFIFPGTYGDRNDLERFFEGFYNRFNLSKPDQIIQCFNDVNADIFFKSIYELNEVLQDSSSRKSLKVHWDYAKLAVLHHSLHRTCACIAMTQDFTDLFEALDIKERNPERLAMIKYIYYQANYPKLSEDFKPLIGSLDSKDHATAGQKLGCILNDLIESVREQGTAYLANQASANGFAVALDLNDPSDSLQCHTNETAALNLKFLYKMSVAVTDGTIQEVVVNTFEFWKNTGKDIMHKIPKDVWQCIHDSNDIKQANEKLGVSIGSKEFHRLGFRYINNHRIAFYGYMKSMRHAYESHNFVHAGNIYGRLLGAIASSK